MNAKKILIIFFLISISISIFSRTPKKLSGSQSGILGPGKYIVTANIQVEAGKCLTILPGTTFIHESGNYIWEISGTFKAIGTKKDSIYFLSKKGVEQKKHWSGLRFLKGAPAATLDYCIVDNVFIKKPANNEFLKYVAAISMWEAKGITIKHSRISNNYSRSNSGAGIYVKEGFTFIDSCKIVYNYQHDHLKGIGVFLEDSKDSQIMNSVIAYNTNDCGG
jgi:hypothetical protein